MRKAFFAVVLVGASFAGGAVVNGPGLRWAQAMILNRLDGADDEPTSPDSARPQPVDEPAVIDPIPATPVPPLVVEAPPATPAKDQGPDQAKAKAKPLANAAPSPEAPPLASSPVPEPKAPAPPKSREPEPAAPPALAQADEPARPRPNKDPQITLVKASTPDELDAPLPLEPADAPTSTSTPAPVTGKGKGNEEIKEPEAKSQAPSWPDAPGSAPAAAVPPRPPEAAAPTANGPIQANPSPVPGPGRGAESVPRASGDWAEVRRKMGTLGVARYGIEGEPGGRVRFHCLIPLAGRHAVAQQFEAEGDDEFQAAEAALRRVALWRATEVPGS